MPDQSTKDHVRRATAALWDAARHRTQAQVTLIEDAVTALAAGRLDEDTRAAAQREAHNIAGSAGMFGFHRASATARELETLFKSGLSHRFVTAYAETLVEQLHRSLRSPDPEPGRRR